MFVLLGGGILLAAFILSIECIQRIREKRKVAQIKIEKHSKKMIRSNSLTVKHNITDEPFRPLTALTTY